MSQSTEYEQGYRDFYAVGSREAHLATVREQLSDSPNDEYWQGALAALTES